MPLQPVSTSGAPAAIGPYSQGMIINNHLIFTAGQVGLVPATMTLIEGGIAEQTQQVFDNLRAVLEAAGTGLHGVVKTTVYLQSMDDFAAMNEVYARNFGEWSPARTTIQVAGLPRAALVEIECVALIERTLRPA